MIQLRQPSADLRRQHILRECNRLLRCQGDSSHSQSLLDNKAILELEKELDKVNLSFSTVETNVTQIEKNINQANGNGTHSINGNGNNLVNKVSESVESFHNLKHNFTSRKRIRFQNQVNLNLRGVQRPYLRNPILIHLE